MRASFALLLRPLGTRATVSAFSVLAVFCLAGFQGNVSTAWAAGDAVPTVAVEEDWELVVGEPDPDTLAPQATVVISPVGNPDLAYAALDINHHSQFDFSNGGMQLQVWANNEALCTADSHANGRLQKNNETITWTQRMGLDGGVLTFSVINGHSETWGNFGGGGELSITFGTSLGDLSGYTSDVSVQNSGIGFASNRVKSLTLKKVRRITAAGDVSEDTTQRVVFQRD